jgi:hypothetical protein
MFVGTSFPSQNEQPISTPDHAAHAEHVHPVISEEYQHGLLTGLKSGQIFTYTFMPPVSFPPSVRGQIIVGRQHMMCSDYRSKVFTCYIGFSLYNLRRAIALPP